MLQERVTTKKRVLIPPKKKVCDPLQKPRPHKCTSVYNSVCHYQQKSASKPAFMHPRNWLIGCWCCSIFKCTQANLALSTALINTDGAENTGGCGEVKHGEAVYTQHDERISVGLGLKMKHESIKVSGCRLEEVPLNKNRYCATNSL